MYLLYTYFTYQLLPEPIRVFDTVKYEDLYDRVGGLFCSHSGSARRYPRFQDSLLIVGKWESIGEPKVPLFRSTSRDLLSHTSGLPPSLSLT